LGFPARAGARSATHPVYFRYADFNLGRYFSIIMGEFLGEVVEIRVYTWMAVELVLVLFFSLETLFGKTVFVVGLFVSGFVMAFLLWLVLHKLQYIRDQIMERTMWLKAERKMKECVAALACAGYPTS